MAPRKTPPKAAPLRTTPALQWAMAILGGVVTAAITGVVIWEALQPAAPPALSARIVAIEATAAGHVAVIKVVNEGDDTASAVDIEGVLGAEQASATVDYVPGHGHAKAFLRFDADPRAASVTVKGWSAP
ncbi:hypothetical protein [Brevundimonas sp.]|uniref:hypothetical protein n=1 Tax=Brevundimonas sp. TaxID=1871086 RepID=UPI003BA9ECBE